MRRSIGLSQQWACMHTRPSYSTSRGNQPDDRSSFIGVQCHAWLASLSLPACMHVASSSSWLAGWEGLVLPIRNFFPKKNAVYIVACSSCTHMETHVYEHTCQVNACKRVMDKHIPMNTHALDQERFLDTPHFWGSDDNSIKTHI